MSSSKPRTKKPKRNDHRWVAIATTSIPDPSVRHPKNGNGRRHVRHVVVSQLIDDRGRHWEKYGNAPPEMLGAPPASGAEK